MIYPILWGVCVSGSGPTQTEINAFQSETVSVVSGTLTFANGNSKYLCIMIPETLNPPDTFVFNGFPVRFNQQIETVVLSDGIGRQFNIYVSSFPQTGTNIPVIIG